MNSNLTEVRCIHTCWKIFDGYMEDWPHSIVAEVSLCKCICVMRIVGKDIQRAT
jgi:hypothetical protein